MTEICGCNVKLKGEGILGRRGWGKKKQKQILAAVILRSPIPQGVGGVDRECRVRSEFKNRTEQIPRCGAAGARGGGPCAPACALARGWCSRARAALQDSTH